jgi:hypothetical protein
MVLDSAVQNSGTHNMPFDCSRLRQAYPILDAAEPSIVMRQRHDKTYPVGELAGKTGWNFWFLIYFQLFSLFFKKNVHNHDSFNDIYL